SSSHLCISHESPHIHPHYYPTLRSSDLPNLDLLRRLPPRLADRALAGRPGGAPARRPLPHRGCPRPGVTAALVIAALVAVGAVRSDEHPSGFHHTLTIVCSY